MRRRRLVEAHWVSHVVRGSLACELAVKPLVAWRQAWLCYFILTMILAKCYLTLVKTRYILVLWMGKTLHGSSVVSYGSKFTTCLYNVDALYLTCYVLDLTWNAYRWMLRVSGYCSALMCAWEGWSRVSRLTNWVFGLILSFIHKWSDWLLRRSMQVWCFSCEKLLLSEVSRLYLQFGSRALRFS